ncbi:hypothetical protein ACFSO0_14490 [Brevibacillus sp. GCM10020057]|uniref:hypothetical protein n=1 Tax=Brevibacillus sp. GCM10020057 TaxID=3317327 RepID=UPI0036322B8E
MIEQWLQPSLRNGGVKETRSYRIGNFLYAGFFGGLLPVLVLGTINCLWLRAKKKETVRMLLAGLLLWATAFFYTWLSGSGYDALLFSRVIAVGYAFVYRLVLKKRFRLHAVVQGVYQPLTKPAVLLVLLAFPPELLLIHAGEVCHHGTLAG